MSATKLHNFLENHVKLSIVIFGDIAISVNGAFVSDINDSDYQEIYFELKRLIDEYVDISSDDNLKILSNFRNEVQSELEKFGLIPQDISGLMEISKIEMTHPTSEPVNDVMELGDTVKDSKILNQVKTFCNLSDPYLGDISQDRLEKILINGEYDQLVFENGNPVNRTIRIPEKLRINDRRDLKLYYEYAHLYYILNFHKHFLKLILDYLDSLLAFIGLDGNAEEKINTDSNYENLRHEFYFNMKKKEVAILFKYLLNLNWIGNLDQPHKDSESVLKTFLDNSNSFYRTKSDDYAPLKDANKEFSYLKVKEDMEDFEEKEILSRERRFLSLFTNTFQGQLNKIDERIKELNVKQKKY